jgi:hypothetical protein
LSVVQALALERDLFGTVSFGVADDERVDTEVLDERVAANATARTIEHGPPEAGKRQRGHKRRPVWVDEEEEAMQVDLAAHSRLRKLRQDKAESVVAGTACSQEA